MAGIVVALAGGIAAFYFGGLRERQKQRYEEQRAEQKRQEEKRKALDDDRRKALDALRTQVFSVIQAFKEWTTAAAKLTEPWGLTQQSEEELKEEVTKLAQQGDEISRQVLALQGFYEAQTPYLAATTRTIFQAFHKELSLRVASLAQGLHGYLLKSSYEPVYDSATEQLKDGGLALGLRIFTAIHPAMYLGEGNEVRKYQKEEFHKWLQGKKIWANTGENLMEAVVKPAEAARNWDYQAHLDALNAEAGRAVDARS